jgi:hypothetical protein
VVTSLASLAGRRLGTGVIDLLDDVVPDKQRVPAGFLRPAGHIGEDLRRRELPEVRHVN